MKKLIYIAVALMVETASLFAQISDARVISLSATLNQVLRLDITNGGNIEFVFSQIDQYKTGLGRAQLAASGDFYETNFTISSSTDWELLMGAEEVLNLVGTDNPLNLMALNNVGFRIISTGVNTCCAAADDITSAGGNHLSTAFATATPNALTTYTGAGPIVITAGGSAAGNSGVAADNVFEISWECGTTITTGTISMTSVALIDAALAPDRYVTNIFLDINGL